MTIARRTASHTLTLVALTFAGLPLGSAAADYPSRPIRFVVPFGAGGTSDIIGRILSARMQESLGQRLVIDNRGGAGGAIGTDIVAKSQPDGYTIVLASNGTHAIVPYLYKKPPYDPIRDFAPVGMVAITPTVLAVNNDLAVRSVKDLIALAKAKPGELNYGSGSSGSTSHLGAELFNAMAGVNIVRIPYRGVGPALLGLLGNQIQVLFPGASSALPYLNSGKLRAIAVASAKPTSLMPGLPTIAASGVPGYEADTPLGVVFPAGVPPKIVDQFNKGIVDALNAPEVRKLVLNQGAEVVGSTPGELAATVKSEMVRWGKLIKEKGIRED
jgi:tripartite-type tricarboxylate transporter receptor subunit TctC